MKTLVIYFSHSGNTRKIAHADADALGAQLCELKSVKRLGIIGGCLKAMGGKAVAIEPLAADMADFDVIKLYSPIWGGCIHPTVNAVIAALPSGKKVEVTAVSSSGKNGCLERVKCAVEARGCELTDFKDVTA